MKTSFLHQSNDRTLPAAYAGDVLIWDIDKTYLDTQFSSLRGLLRIPLELAVDKKSIRGSVPLLRALRHGGGVEPAVVPLYFISGSPVQLRDTVERKMTLDGVDYDGITFKDQWGLVRAGRPRGVKEQVGYKLKALLAYQQRIPNQARFLLFGDDVESDAEVFLLFGEVCAGLRDNALTSRLEGSGVHKTDIAEIEALTGALPVIDDPVDRVFIHLTDDSDPTSFSDPRVVAAQSYIQSALVLAEMGRIQPPAIASVAKDLRRRGSPEYLIEHHVDDAVRRFGVSRELSAFARG